MGSEDAEGAEDSEDSEDSGDAEGAEDSENREHPANSEHRRNGRPCPHCETPMYKRHCKYICPQHGVVFDCADTFWV
ncbi:HVO_2523 family zinc finger protein [Natrialba magadii]|uniref:HVO_2523 family zinc finger protein n=1 Tax=Natrialba magadii TaxID=13769 RepID=UPI001F17E826|nr:HVO_2523 family zinc finger protein [Natrialba magadii]